MYGLLGTDYSQRYRPTAASESGGGPLSDLKRLLASRSSPEVRKATGFIAELIERCPERSPERERIINYLLEGDICIFLCDTMASMDWEIVSRAVWCLQLMSGCRALVRQEHGAYVVACSVRLCASYLAPGPSGLAAEPAIEACFRLMADIFTSARRCGECALASKSLYGARQLLGLAARLAELGPSRRLSLAAGLLLATLLAHPPPHLRLSLQTAEGVATAAERWLPLLCGAATDAAADEMFYGLVCQLAADTLGLSKCIQDSKQQGSFVENIITTDEDILQLKQQTKRMESSVHLSALHLITYTKDNWENVSNSDYLLFLKLLKAFLTDAGSAALMSSVSEALVNSGFLVLLPKNKVIRGTAEIDSLSTRNLSEMLSHLSRHFLGDGSVPHAPAQHSLYIDSMTRELADLPEDAMSWPREFCSRLCKQRPHCLLVYLYFHFLSVSSPQLVSAPLLPHLAQHVNALPAAWRPPDHVLRCLWLVFAMSRISNSSPQSLPQRVRCERASRRLTLLVSANPRLYYTHHPSLLLHALLCRAGTSRVLNLWLERESYLPEELANHPTVMELLLEVVQTSRAREAVLHAAAILKRRVLEQDDDTVEQFGEMLWMSLPDALAAILQNYDSQQGVNLQCLVELSTETLPKSLDPALQQKLTLLTARVFSKMCNGDEQPELAYFCLKLTYYILNFPRQEDENKALTIVVNSEGFLRAVLGAARGSSEPLACMALQLLSYVVHAFARSRCQCDSELRLEPVALAGALYRETNSPRGAALLQLFHAVVSNAAPDRAVPLSLAVPPAGVQAAGAVRSLLFRIQMICCKESREKSATGWNTLSVMLKYFINHQRSDEVVMFATQPWMFTLVRFQLTQRIATEFLVFIKSWLMCLKLIFHDRSLHKSDCSHSLFFKTMMLIKRALVRYIESEGSQRPKILDSITEIVDYFVVED